MKYLVNRVTKEHRAIEKEVLGRYSHGDLIGGRKWHVVEADSEGWIPHAGDECPLPEDVRCGLRFDKIKGWSTNKPQLHDWVNVTHYRPILDDKASKQLGEPEMTPKRDIIDRLKAAHQAASEIPDLVAELRQALEPMGLGVMYLSQFDEVTK